MKFSNIITFNVISILFALFLVNQTNAIKADPNSTLFIDQYSRKAMFHGVNVVYKTYPFYPDTQNYSANYSLTDHDLFNLRSWGFNMIRLHVAWEGVQPQRGKYNYTYVQKLRKIVRKCNNFGIWVLLDAHQDLFNRKFCGQGFPDWTIKINNFPKPLKVKLQYDQQGYPKRQDCLKIPFSMFYLTEDVMQFQQDFFTNKRGLWTSFTNMWRLVSSYMARQPNLLGYEIVNEPIGANLYKQPGTTLLPGAQNNKYILPAYKTLYKAIRENDRQNLIFFEPSVLDPVSGGFDETPGQIQSQLSRQVFSYHIYCPYVTPLGQPKSTQFCNVFDQLQVASKQINVRSLKVGAFMTQFGALSGTKKSAKQLQILTSLLEDRLHSWSYWQFKYYNDITTMANPGTTQSFYNLDGSLQTNKVKALARPYAPYICSSDQFEGSAIGSPLKSTFDYQKSIYVLRWRHKQCFNMKTEVYLSEQYYYENGFVAKFSRNNSDKYCKLNKKNKQSKNQNNSQVSEINLKQMIDLADDFYYEVQCDIKMIGKVIELTVSPKK